MVVICPVRGRQKDERRVKSVGYSGTPLLQKLGVKEGVRFALVNAPRGFARAIEPLPFAVKLTRGSQESDVVLLFATSAAALTKSLEPSLGRLRKDGGSLWVAWPKKASGVATDLTFDHVQRAGLALGVVDTKICAIDEVWSGLRFSRRRAK